MITPRQLARDLRIPRRDVDVDALRRLQAVATTQELKPVLSPDGFQAAVGAAVRARTEHADKLFTTSNYAQPPVCKFKTAATFRFTSTGSVRLEQIEPIRDAVVATIESSIRRHQASIATLKTAAQVDGVDETVRLLAEFGVHDAVERDRMLAGALMSRNNESSTTPSRDARPDAVTDGPGTDRT